MWCAMLVTFCHRQRTFSLLRVPGRLSLQQGKFGLLVNLDHCPPLECAILNARFQLCCKLWGIRWDGGSLGLSPPLRTSSLLPNAKRLRDRSPSVAVFDSSLPRLKKGNLAPGQKVFTFDQNCFPLSFTI